MRRLLGTTAVACATLATAPAAAQSWAGTWALQAEGRPIWLLTIARDGAAWRADERVLHWRGDTGDQATGLHGPATRKRLGVIATTRSTATLVYPDGTRFRLRPLTASVAEWRFDGDSGSAATGGDSGAVLIFSCVSAITPLASHLDPARTYAIDAPWPDNPAMARLFDADQADRRSDQIDWSVVGPADARRRAATQALLDADALHSGTDFYGAAFVFQHGATLADYPKAHVLAVIAAARGRRDAAWIAAATLDRYLQNIGGKQVYGTQYTIPRGGRATQEPYDRSVLSDGLRRATGVPTQAEQEERRKQYDQLARP